ncbi:MAG TPA: AI-2E family transporter [Gemmataceae bacterium]|nr:AI-2E family transporter [Gemmataceae bacterium]
MPNAERTLPVTPVTPYPPHVPPPVRFDSGLWEFTRRLLVIVVFVVVGLFIWYGLKVLLLAFAGALLAVLLYSLADWVSRHTRLPYVWATLLVIVVLAGLLALLGWLLAARIGAEMTQLASQWPQSLKKLQDELGSTSWGKALLEQSSLQGGPGGAQALVERVNGALSVTLDAVAGILVVLFVGIYGAFEPQQYRKGMLYLVPASGRHHAGQLLDSIAYTVRWWLIGQLLVMLITGVLVTVGLWLLHVPMALVLGLIAFCLEIIPTVGPFLFAIPGVLIALSMGPTEAIYVIILYVVVQGIESNLLVPLIQKQTVWLPPVLTILVEIFMWMFAGVLGLFLAAPLTAAALVTVKMLYVKDTLGTQAVRVPGQDDKGPAKPEASKPEDPPGSRATG